MSRVMTFLLCSVLFGAAVGVVVSTATAGTLYVVEDTSGALYELDLVNEIAWPVAYLDLAVSYPGLAFDSSLGTLWVSNVYFSEPGYGLGMLDMLNGQISPPPGSRPYGDAYSINIMGLAYDSTNDVLYGADSSFYSKGLVMLVRKQEDDPTPPLWCGDDDQVPPCIGDSVEIGPWTGGADIRALAYDSLTDTLYGACHTNLYTIDRATGAATVVGPHGIPAGPAYVGLAFDPDSGLLYAVGGDSSNLYVVDPASGVASLLFDTCVSTMSGLACIPDPGGRLYVSEDESNTIWTIDPKTGRSTLLGPVGAGIDLDRTGMTFHAGSRQVLIYGVTGTTPGYMLGRVDPGSGSISVTGVQHVNEFPIAGLAYDPARAALWGADTLRNQLVQVDAGTGATVLFSDLDQHVKGLTYDRVTDTLFGASDAFLYRVHVVTKHSPGGEICFSPGDTEQLAPWGDGDETFHLALEKDPATGILYGLDSSDGIFSQINQLTYEATPVGPTALLAPSGLAMVEGVLFSSSFEAGSFDGWSGIVE